MKYKFLIAFGGFLFGLFISYLLLTYTPFLGNVMVYIPEEPYPPTKDVVPDEETAMSIAEAIFDSYYDNSDAYEGNYFTEQDKKDIELHVTFNKDENTWSVYYFPVLYEESNVSKTIGLPQITIRRNNGEIINIGFSE